MIKVTQVTQNTLSMRKVSPKHQRKLYTNNVYLGNQKEMNRNSWSMKVKVVWKLNIESDYETHSTNIDQRFFSRVQDFGILHEKGMVSRNVFSGPMISLNFGELMPCYDTSILC